ncbi:hypothetical protein LB543_22375 [Mesorhizobium sp. ESP7-2]|nr:hypothetical protein [Mesorhizobium sp. ESP7-2]
MAAHLEIQRRLEARVIKRFLEKRLWELVDSARFFCRSTATAGRLPDRSSFF